MRGFAFLGRRGPSVAVRRPGIHRRLAKGAAPNARRDLRQMIEALLDTSTIGVAIKTSGNGVQVWCAQAGARGRLRL